MGNTVSIQLYPGHTSTVRPTCQDLIDMSFRPQVINYSSHYRQLGKHFHTECMNVKYRGQCIFKRDYDNHHCYPQLQHKGQSIQNQQHVIMIVMMEINTELQSSSDCLLHALICPVAAAFICRQIKPTSLLYVSVCYVKVQVRCFVFSARTFKLHIHYVCLLNCA